MKVEESARAMVADSTKEALVSPSPCKVSFQHQNTFGSLHNSDHNGVVGIFVGHSEIVKR